VFISLYLYFQSVSAFTSCLYREKVGERSRSLKLSSVSVAKSVRGGGIVSAEGSGGDIIGVDVIIFEHYSLVISMYAI